MKYKILYTLLAFVAIAFGCKKTAFDNDVKGEALGDFTITGPANNTMLVLNSATPNQTVEITWTAAKPGVNTAPNYKWVAALKTGNIDQPLLEIPSDNNGSTAKLTLTQKQLDDALKGKGIAEGVKTDLIWTVIADNGSLKIKGATYNISVTRFGDGVSNFILYGPLSSFSPIAMNPESTTESLKFKWQKSFAGKTGGNVTYKIKFVKDGGDFNTPLMQFVSSDNGADSSFTITYKDLDLALKAAGLSDQSKLDSLKWSVEASSGTFKKFSDYTNDVVIKREVKMFLVGGDTPASWTAEAALPMIADTGNPGTFYIYVKLNAGNGGFKFLNQQQWPGQSLNSSDWGMKKGSPGDAAESDEDNISNYGASGIYRVTFDQKNLKYYVQADHGLIGAVGGATDAGWNPPGVFPSQELNYMGVNRFLGLVNLKNNEEWKLIDGNSWGNGGGPVSQSRDYGMGATAGSLLETGENNIKNSDPTGLYRIIWDGTDVKNLKYSVTEGAIYLIGNATAGGWNNDAANNAIPAMTYQGNGKWKITTNLTVGEMKFIVKKGSWDYNYGSDGTTSSIKDNGDNIAVNSAGSYTITVDEYGRTYTLIKN